VPPAPPGQPGGAGAAERVAGSQHPVRADAAGGAVPAQHRRGAGRGPGDAVCPRCPRQRAADGAGAAGRGAGTRWGHAAPGRPLPHLHLPEQPAVRGHLQPARGHLPGHVPAEDPDHGRVLGAAAGHVAVPHAVGVAGAAVPGGGPGADRPAAAAPGVPVPGAGSPPEPAGGAGGRRHLLLVLGLRRRLLRAAAQEHGRLHLAAQRAAGRRGHRGGAAGHAAGRGLLG
ncbi:UDP-galactose translocator-like, partial [Columba livia]